MVRLKSYEALAILGLISYEYPKTLNNPKQSKKQQQKTKKNPKSRTPFEGVIYPSALPSNSVLTKNIL